MRALILITSLLAAPSSALGAGLGPSLDRQLDQRLADLSAPSAVLRAQAQSWLAIHARAEDFPELAERARSGDAEVRGRIARALASDDRHLTLAVSFAGESVPALAAIGEQALIGSALRWSDALEDAPLVEAELVRMLGLLAKRQVAPPLAIDLARPLDENLRLLRRHGRLPLALVAEPSLLTRPELDNAPRMVAGSWAELVLALAAEHGVALEGHGLGSLDAPLDASRRWLRFAPLPERGRASGAELLARWCERVAAAGTQARRAAAARALAASGWPAGLAWLEQRWLGRKDEAALEGLFLAASTGRVAASLTRPAMVRELCARADLALARDDEAGIDVATELLYVLGAVGCLGAAGEDLHSLPFETWDECSTRQRWWRLAVLERSGCRISRSDPVAVLLESLLAASDVPLPLRLQGLRAWSEAVAPESPAEVAEVRGLIERADELHEARELLRLFRRSGLAPPDAWRRGIAGDETASALVCAWWLSVGELEAAAQTLVAALRDARTFTLLSDARVRGLGSSVKAVAMRAFELIPAEREDDLELLAFRLDLIEAGLLGGLRERTGPLEEASSELLGIWGSRGNQPEAIQARDLLLLRLSQALEGEGRIEEHHELVQAIQFALDGLFTAGLDPEGERMVLRLRRFLEARADSPLALDLEKASFPTPPGAPVEPLRRRERRLEPGALR